MRMRRSTVLWILALLVTVVAARWQERTGPTYPVRGEVSLGGATYDYELTRSWSEGDQPVSLDVADPAVVGRVRWRRYPTTDPWAEIAMQRTGDALTASLPHQPPAGKLEYQVELSRDQERAVLPAKAAITRFKGDVSWSVLGPHIAAMFLALLFTTRAGLEGLVNGPAGRSYTWIGVGLLMLGGFVLGPVVQKAAFGAYWTGVPWGWDLTDNKTLLMGLAWLWAAWRVSVRRDARWSLVAAAVVGLAVFVIPHSTWGSEVQW
jgi:hypothetical protein